MNQYLLSVSSDVLMGAVVVSVLLTPATEKQAAFAKRLGGPGFHEIQESKKTGLQFVFDDMATIDEVIRRNKVIVGRYRFEKSGDGYVVGRLHHPNMNYSPEQRFISGGLKIKFPKDRIDPKIYRGTIVVRATGKNDLYEVIAFQTGRVTNKDLFLPSDKDGRFVSFMRQIFSSKKHRYEKLVDELIEELGSEDQQTVFQSMYMLTLLRSDAKAAIKPLQQIINKNQKEPIRTARAITTLKVIGGETATKAVVEKAIPVLIKGIRSSNFRERSESLLACEKLGSQFKGVIQPIVDTMSDFVSKLETNEKKDDKLMVFSVVSMIRTLGAIDRNDARVVAAIKPLLKSKTTPIHEAARSVINKK